MDSVTRVKNLDKAVFILHGANTQAKVILEDVLVV